MKMSKPVGLIGLGMLILCLTGCAARGKSSAPVTDTATAKASATLTVSPTETTSPTPTEAAVRNGINLPPVMMTVTAHPLALNEFNARTEMKLLNTYGTGVLEDITFSPNGKYLAAATGRGIYLYDGKTFNQISFIDVDDVVEKVAFSPDGLTIAAAIHGKVSLWGTLSGKKMSTLADGDMLSVISLVYGTNGRIAAVGDQCPDGCGERHTEMILWDDKTGQQIYSEKDVWYYTYGLAFTPDGKHLAFGAPDGLTIIDAQTGKLVYQPDHKSKLNAVFAPFDFIFDRDGKNLLITTLDPDLTKTVFNLSTHQISELSVCSALITRIANAGVCPVDGQVIFFDLATAEKISTLEVPGLDPKYMSTAISNSGDYFAYGKYTFDQYGPKTALHILNVKTRAEIKTFLFDNFDAVQTSAVTLEGKTTHVIGLINQPDQLDLLDVETSAVVRSLKWPAGQIESFAFRPDGKTLAMMDEKSTLTLWDLQSGKNIYQTSMQPDLENQLAFSPDGMDILFTTYEERKIVDLNLLTGETSSLGNGYWSKAFDADPAIDAVSAADRYHFNHLGNLVTLAYQNKSPVFTDLKTHQKITLPYALHSDQLEADPDYIDAFAFSPDEKSLVIGSSSDIFVWDLATLKQTATLSGHEAHWFDRWALWAGTMKIRNLMFNPQSNLLASLGWDETIRLWDIHSGQELQRLNICCSASFTADGRYLLTAGNGVLRVWGISK